MWVTRAAEISTILSFIILVWPMLAKTYRWGAAGGSWEYWRTTIIPLIALCILLVSTGYLYWFAKPKQVLANESAMKIYFYKGPSFSMDQSSTTISFDIAVTNDAPNLTGARDWEVIFKKDSNSTKLELVQLASNEIIKDFPLDRTTRPRVITADQLVNQMPTKLYRGGVLSGVLMVRTKELTWDAFDRGTFTISFADDFGNRYSQTTPDMPQSPPPKMPSPQTN